jgi:hypothetical protein
MSCAWDVKCITCDVEMKMAVNDGVEFMRLLIKNAEVIAALDKIRGIPPWSIELESACGSVNTAFIAEHCGHELVPFNEYGQRADECSQYVRCNTCGSQMRCVLPPDHVPSTPHSFKKVGV